MNTHNDSVASHLMFTKLADQKEKKPMKKKTESSNMDGVALLLPVTFTSRGLKVGDSVLSPKTKVAIEKLILGDLKKVDHAEVSGVEVCDQLFLLEEINAYRDQSIFDDVEKIEKARRRGKVITKADLALLDEALSIVKARQHGKVRRP